VKSEGKQKYFFGPALAIRFKHSLTCDPDAKATSPLPIYKRDHLESPEVQMLTDGWQVLTVVQTWANFQKILGLKTNFSPNNFPAPSGVLPFDYNRYPCGL